MNNYMKILLSSALIVSSQSALAQHDHPHFSPAGAVIEGDGVGRINSTECDLTFTGVIGPAVVEGSVGPNNHAEYVDVDIVNYGTGCDGKTVSARLHSNGYVTDVVVTGVHPLCDGTYPGPFGAGSPAAVITGTSAPTVTVSSIPVGVCTLGGVFNAFSPAVFHPLPH